MECGKWKVELFQFGKWNKLYFYKEWIMVFLCCFFPDLYIIDIVETRVSNEKVNFEIEKVRIETQARIEIATKTATIMAELGKNAQFVNIGGSSQGSQTGNALLDTLSGIPELMKILDTKNQADVQRLFYACASASLCFAVMKLKITVIRLIKQNAI